jgi:hypothetical protein
MFAHIYSLESTEFVNQTFGESGAALKTEHSHSTLARLHYNH